MKGAADVRAHPTTRALAGRPRSQRHAFHVPRPTQRRVQIDRQNFSNDLIAPTLLEAPSNSANDAAPSYLSAVELRRRLVAALPDVRALSRDQLVHTLAGFESPLPPEVHRLTDAALRKRVKTWLPDVAGLPREQLLAECVGRGLVSDAEARARRTRPDISQRRKESFDNDEVCRRMSLSRLLRGQQLEHKHAVVQTVIDAVKRLSAVVHQRSFLVLLHVRRLIADRDAARAAGRDPDEAAPLPDLTESNATFFRHCFTVGIGSSRDAAVETTLATYQQYFWALPRLPKGLANAVSHAAKLYKTNFVNHFTLLDNVVARIRKLVSIRLHGIRVDAVDPDGFDRAELSKSESVNGVKAVTDAVVSGCVPDEMSERSREVVQQVRAMLDAPGRGAITEAWLKTHIESAMRFALETCRTLDVVKAEASLLAAQGVKLRRGVGKGVKFCPTHRCAAHCVKLDASDLERVFRAAGVVPADTLGTPLEIVRSVLSAPLAEAYGQKLADCFSGTIDTDGTSVAVHFLRPIPDEQLALKRERIAEAREAKAERERRAAEGLPTARKMTKRSPNAAERAAVPKVLLAADVGRVNLVVVTAFVDGKPLYAPSASGKQRRVVFKLTAAHLYTASGIRRRARITRRRRSAMGLDASVRALSQTSLRSANVDDVLRHLATFAASRDRSWEWAMHSKTRQDKLRSRAGRARVMDRFFSRIRTALKARFPSLRASEVVVAWGNAKVAATGRGNVAVPTSGVGRAAALRFKRCVQSADEYMTSQTCPEPSCHCKVHAVRVFAPACCTKTVWPMDGRSSRDVRRGFVTAGTNARRLVKRLARQPQRVGDGRTVCSVAWKLDGHAGESDEVKKEKKAKRGAGYVEYMRGLRFCPGCQKLHDRDVMGADNIARLWLYDHCLGGRPPAFDRTVQAELRKLKGEKRRATTSKRAKTKA